MTMQPDGRSFHGCHVLRNDHTNTRIDLKERMLEVRRLYMFFFETSWLSGLPKLQGGRILDDAGMDVGSSANTSI